ncbi:MAG: hypothetical protein AAF409_16160 [Pseudomonadota bacterium]
MKASSSGSERALWVLLGGAILIAPLVPLEEIAQATNVSACAAIILDDDSRVEGVMAPHAKISSSVAAEMARSPDQHLDVVIVLNVPKPDLSHLFGKRGAEPLLSEEERGRRIDAAEAEVAAILERTGGVELKRLRNAASMLVRVDAVAVENLAASDCVLEIIENATLRN